MATRKCGNIYFTSEIFYGRQAVSYEEIFSKFFGLEGSKKFFEKIVRCTI